MNSYEQKMQDCVNQGVKALRSLNKKLGNNGVLGDWNCISVHTENINAKNKMIEIGFKEPRYQPVTGYNVYFATLDNAEYKKMLNEFYDYKFSYNAIETTVFGSDEYVMYLAGDLQDPRD